MDGVFCYPEDVDRNLNWPLGTATRMARRGQLPHYVLPNGAIRFCLEEVKRLVRYVPPHPVVEVANA